MKTLFLKFVEHLISPLSHVNVCNNSYYVLLGQNSDLNASVCNENGDSKYVFCSDNLDSDNFDMSFKMKRYIENENEIANC